MKSSFPNVTAVNIRHSILIAHYITKKMETGTIQLYIPMARKTEPAEEQTNFLLTVPHGLKAGALPHKAFSS